MIHIGLTKPTFKDFTFKDGHLSAKIMFSVFGGRFRNAQLWLDQEIMNDMRPMVPYRTGKFLGEIEAKNHTLAGTGRIVSAVPPHGKWLYGGVRNDGTPIRYTNPSTVPKWGAVTIAQNKEKYMQGVKERLKEKK